MTDIQSIICHRLTLGSWAKLAFISNVFAFMSVGLLTGLASLLGMGHVGMGGHMVQGWFALPAALFATFFMGLAFAAGSTVFGFVGLWVFSRFSNMRLDVITTSPSESSSGDVA